jgi:hypothetical protein
MTENEKLLNTFMEAAEAFFRSCVALAAQADPEAHRQASKWLDSPGSRVELRVDFGGLRPAPTHAIRAFVVDDGGEPLWELFSVITPSGNT